MKCLSCGHKEFYVYKRFKGTVDAPTSEPELTAVVCCSCGYLMYDMNYGYAEGIRELMSTCIAMAEEQDLPKADLQEFLTMMGIPLCYQPGGRYYVEDNQTEDR